MGFNPFAPISDRIRQARESIDTARKLGMGRGYQGDGHSHQDADRAAKEAADKAMRTAMDAIGKAHDLVGQYKRAEDLNKDRLDRATKDRKKAEDSERTAAGALKDYDRDVERGKRTHDPGRRSSLQRAVSQAATEATRTRNLEISHRKAYTEARNNHSRAKREFRKLHRELTK